MPRIKTRVVITHNKHFTLGNALGEAPINDSLSLSPLPGSYISLEVTTQTCIWICIRIHTHTQLLDMN